MYYLLIIFSIVLLKIFFFEAEFSALILMTYINFLKNKYLWQIKSNLSLFIIKIMAYTATLSLSEQFYGRLLPTAKGYIVIKRGLIIVILLRNPK